MNVIQTMISLTEQVKRALPGLTWQVTNVGEMRHYTGRGDSWTVQLVRLTLASSRIERMGTASRGQVVFKLPDELAAEAERLAMEATP